MQKTKIQRYPDIASHSSRSVGKLRNQTVYRQNSNSISTDTSGAAIQTINNILNGITESVNRLTELQYRMPDRTGSGKIHTVKVDNLPQNKISKNIPEASQAPKPPS
ncbi:hypothetical protein HHI36_018900 [Cryptolaemus montrouzieri]|uniref:Uncharacterized protein n=1 Tax=Cryptolaemus montrouzieri TaxID=559131 RepID=A0ABD2P1C2_9CUCU